MWVHDLTCKHTHSWSLLSVVEHTVAPEQLSPNWHPCTLQVGTQHVQQGRHPDMRDPTCTQVQSLQIHAKLGLYLRMWHICTCRFMHNDICELVAKVLLNVNVYTVTICLHGLGRVPFSLSLFSSLNGKRLSAISFCQQLGDTLLQLAAICFNYVY